MQFIFSKNLLLKFVLLWNQFYYNMTAMWYIFLFFLTNYGRRLFTNCHGSWDTLYLHTCMDTLYLHGTPCTYMGHPVPTNRVPWILSAPCFKIWRLNFKDYLYFPKDLLTVIFSILPSTFSTLDSSAFC